MGYLRDSAWRQRRGFEYLSHCHSQLRNHIWAIRMCLSADYSSEQYHRLYSRTCTLRSSPMWLWQKHTDALDCNCDNHRRKLWIFLVARRDSNVCDFLHVQLRVSVRLHQQLRVSSDLCFEPRRHTMCLPDRRIREFQRAMRADISCLQRGWV